MRRRSTRGASRAGGLWLLALAACGGGELATRWVPPEAAVVRCTTAGRHRMPPVLLDLPLPAVPTGLLARQLDPMALNDMGYEREHPICASLARPSAEAIETARDGVSSLLAIYRQTGSRARVELGRCTCDVARIAGVAELLAPCHDEPHRPTCTATPDEVQRVTALVEPLREALASTPIPRLHWRVAGRSDRPGWVVRRLTELLPRHAGGATAFVPGQAVPSRHNHALIRRLLDVPGTVAVLRLDGGQSVLVVRELDGAQVLDLLSFPPVDPALAPLLPHIDEARGQDVVDALEQPATAWAPPLPLDRGNVVFLDRSGMRAVDALVLAMAPLAGQPRAPRELPEPPQEPLVDAVTLQADFGTDGTVLRAQLQLSEAGQLWAQTVGDAQLGSQLEQLGLPLEPPPLAPAVEPEVALPFYRGATDRLVLDGLQRAPALLRTLEMTNPSSV
ncbi:MAG: hypothetical protein KDK70_38635, partial [Myxococcales bacterium]|nr:hypothetical protein [Myxococcales bacterium]